MQQRERRKAVEQETSVNMTPMIDVTFQLLIFFLVTLQFRTLEKKIHTNLPTEFGTGGPVLNEAVTVKLRKSLVARRSPDEPARPPRYFFEREPMPSLEAVARRLGEFRNAYPDIRVKLDAGEGVEYGQVVRVVDMMKRVGYEQISFTGLRQKRLRELGVR